MEKKYLNGCKFSINKDLLSVVFINDSDEKRNWGENCSHYGIMHRLFNFMRDRRFKIVKDKSVNKLIRKDYWYGRRKDLEFKAHRYPRGFSIEFYQNVRFKNRNGGYYDFDKFEKMPYLLRLIWINEVKKMGEFLEHLGIKNDTDIEYKFVEDIIKKDFVESCHYPQNNMDFNLSDLDGTTHKESYNNTDRNNKTIYNGQIKYFRSWNGRLMRGRVYHNINNMWWVIINSTERRNVADFELFDPTEEDFKNRRIKKDRKPKEYLKKIEIINKLSNKELLREIKRRKLKVKF